MEQGLEELLEIMVTQVHHLHVQVLQVKLQLSLQFKVFSVQTFIMSEHLTLETVFLHDFDVINSLLFHANNSPQLVSVLVFLTQILIADRNHSRLLHQLLMLDISIGEFFIDDHLNLFFRHAFT
jgi:hypothetical protein